MGDQIYHFLKECGRVLDIDPTTLRNIIVSNNVPHLWVDGRMIVSEAAIEQVRPHVEAWKNRPRMSKPSRATA